MEATPARGRGVGPGEVVSESFAIYRDNASTLLGVSALVFVVVGAISGLLQAAGVIGALLALIVQLVGGALFTGFVVQLVLDVRDGRRDMTANDLVSAAMPAIGPLIGFGILFGIAVGIGFVLFIVPGAILLTIWCLGAPAIVAERQGVMAAFGRSRELVRGNGWNVFGALLLVLVIVFVVYLVIGLIGAAIGGGVAIRIVTSIVANIIAAPVFALATSVMFFDLGGGVAEVDSGATVAAGPQPPLA